MPRDPAEAREIAKAGLESTAAAIMSGDFTAVEKAFATPTVFDTFEGRGIVNSYDELQDRFQRVCAHYIEKGVTRLEREIVDCYWFDNETIHITHESKLFNGDDLVQTPFTTFTVLKHLHGGWKCTYCTLAIPDSVAHNDALLGAPLKGETHD